MAVVSTATRPNRRPLSFSICALTLTLLFGAAFAEAQPNVKYNFAGSDAAEIGRWHPANTEFKVWDISGQAFTTYTLGSSGAKPAPGNFGGDNKTDAGVFQNGVWIYKTSPGAAAQTITMSSFVAGDIPAAGDFNGDGFTDAAIFRPSTGTWLIKQGASEIAVAFGQSGDIPVVGDFDGDGKSDCTIYRPTTGVWWIRRSTDFAFIAFQWGVATDIPVHGDFDGDGKSDPTVFRPTEGSWYVLKSSSGHTTFDIHNWGNWADQPVPAMYDSDAKTDVAIWRETTGQWYILKSTGGVDIHGLGVAGDTAIPSSYTKQVGGEVGDYAMNTARLSPKNATGGTDYYSRNFGWGTSLAGLPGRSGMDAGIGLSYNSLTWINVDSVMYFDPDSSNVAPGFRLGPPVIEPVYYNAPPDNKGGYAYIMVTPDGRRIQFKQSLASNTYFTADSSYAKLTTKGAENPNDPVEDVDLTVTTSEGTVMKFEWTLGGYRCERVTDRNGNYITYAYDTLGELTSLTDTLGRILNVNYNSDGTPLSITQQWSTGLHTWATFSYATKAVNTSFAIAAQGPPNGTNVTVLDKVTYADGSKTKFTYDGNLQVTEVENLANNNSLLNSTAPSYATSGVDVPRMTQTAVTTSNFNGGGNSTVTVANSPPTAETFTAPTISESTSVVNVTVSPHPNSLYTRIHYAPSGWKEGQTIATEDCVSDCGSGRKRWTWNQWTQDNTNLGNILNPRIVESRVGDSVNTKKTEIGYTANQAPDTYRLPSSVLVTNIATGAQIASTSITYVTSSAYTDRRILRLPSFVTTSGWNSETNNLQAASSTSYYYDEGDFTGAGQNISASQHDSEFGASLLTGRGNVTRIRRNEVGGGNYTDTEIRYNVTGSPVKQIDALDRETSISYADSFAGSPPSPTYAYPTSITDPGGYTSSISYRYDMGANVSASSPNGFSSTRTFDTIGRLQQQSVTGGAYTRYEYFNNGRQFKTFSTITDGLGETESESWTDGAGRTYQSRSELPNSVGGWSAVKTTYDILGRVTEQSVPTEVNSSWNPTGDDSGWTSSSTTYDWKGRPLSVTPAGASGSASTTYEYIGCGCTGGQITTIRGAQTDAVNVAGTLQNGRRTQKVYEDIVGRVFKTETYDLDGLGLPYSTVRNWFNGRGQATLIRQFQGPDTGGTFQDTTAAFDGYGRLISSHKPEQTGSTAYTYFNDDSIQKITDARGAETLYIYENVSGVQKRPLVTKIEWNAPSGIIDPADVSFAYDNVGNRTSMTDAFGTQTYSYDTLSRMTSETRPITGVGTYTLNYTYTLGGQLQSISYPGESNRTITYGYDKTGRVTGVTGGGFGNVYNYLTGMQYRAFGGVKTGSYGSGKTLTQSYNERLNLSNYTVTGTANTTYGYHNDGSVKSVTDNLDGRFDRLMRSDFAGRLKIARTGLEARDENQMTNDRPFRQDYGYTAFSNLNSRTNNNWGVPADPVSDIFVNNRKQPYSTLSWTYDNDGRETYFNQNLHERVGTTFDAAGRRFQVTEENYNTTYNIWQMRWNITQGYDGDGQRIMQQENGASWPNYFIRSSVMGGAVVAELRSADGSTWAKDGFVMLGGEIIAQQKQNSPTSADEVKFMYTNPVTGAQRGAVQTEPDPLGTNQGLQQQQPNPPIYSGDSGIMDPGRYADAFNGNFCSDTGAIMPCEAVYNIISRSHGSTESAELQLMFVYQRRQELLQRRSRPSPDVPTTGPPKLKLAPKRTKEQVKLLRDIAATGTFDNEDLYSNVDPPDLSNIWKGFAQAFKLGIMIADRVKILGFTEAQETTIRESIAFMTISKECADAFRKYNLATPAEVIRDRNVVIAHNELLQSSANNQALGLSNQIRVKILMDQKLESQGFTIFELPGPVYTFFNNGSFGGGASATGERMVHETIHRASIGKRQSFWGWLTGDHDLSGYDGYSEILEKCRRPEER